MTGGCRRIEVSFPSGDASCAAWLYLPDPAATARPDARRPVVVLGHGLGATRDMSLDAFAEDFRADGYACVVFDYRHFGDSGGQPRQLLDIEQELTDWSSAIAYARSHPSCDPERVVLWGSSFGGGHALTAAARDGNVAAVVAQCPFTDGIASILRHDPVASMRVAARAVRDVVGAARGRAPVTVGLVGRRRSAALLTAPDALPGYAALLTPGTTFRNEVAARFAFQLPRYRPGRRLREVRCPVLLCLCSEDSVAPTARTRRYAAAGTRTRLHEYPFGHFAIYLDGEREVVLHDQLEFLRREVPIESGAA
ncbi:alpha/beta hydrolase [Actinomycetospora sp. NBRC 106375]|uniref:alpha/beta hydrolase n=1 Tax=Actinomycetospora sp. NBRC 106375 TaxID=3032207 RepID=UPI0024A3DF36|nr:alpha/beta fold hydrolase [Actinomycetospora sp. NBRC 106375]GLZ49158.1 alpha/beta hydrolase [Actinomycetospora sp. NBRC 106375]